MPDNIINIQFKDISLKNICRYGNVCSALLQRRTFYTDNKILTCESGKEVVNLNDYDKYENSFSNLMDTTMQKRKCNNCIANKKCSKCSSIKDEYLESYCRIQKNQYSILEIIMFMNYVIKQIIDPLDLVEYSMIQNEIIFPRQEKLEVKAIISLNEKKYFVRKSDRGYSLLKIGDSMYECIKMYWECNDYAKVNIFLKVKYNLADDKRKKILEYMRLNF